MRRSLNKKRIACIVCICCLVVIWGYLYLPLDKELFSDKAGISLKITDRHGILLREVLSAEGGRSTWLTYEEIPEHVVNAVVGAEDKRFFSHGGVDLLALGRAAWQNLWAGRVVSGASTITQQVIKNRFDYPRTLWGKLQEMIMAVRLEHTLSKQEILEQYLNRVEFCNLTFGIEAASQLYFQKPAQHLSLAESVFLAGIIQAPSRLNPYRHVDRALQRQCDLLDRMYRNAFIDNASYQIARQEKIRLTPKQVNFKAPHFCEMVLSDSPPGRGWGWVKSVHTTSDIVTHPHPLPGGEFTTSPYKNPYLSTPTPPLEEGGKVIPEEIRTTLDYYLQEKVEDIVETRLTELEDYNVSNAAVLVLDNRTGDIVAYVGSRDYFDDTISGQVDGVRALRQPGSTLKPFTYQLALERAYTPATLLPDIKDYPASPRSFVPENYDRKFHGPVRLRQALACSYNVPAVRVLERIGVETLYNRLHAFGFESLHELPSFYGPGLTLGNGEVTLLELTRAYSILARGGKDISVRYVLEVEDGHHLESETYLERLDGAHLGRWEPPLEGEAHLVRSPAPSTQHPALSTQLFSPQAIYLITHILADRQAAVPAFGEDTPLKLPFPTAVKTGTSKDYRDNWTIGFTSDYTVGVWVGNFDGSPMQRVSGITGAAPIYRDIMLHVYRYYDPPGLLADPPPGLANARICPLSGKLADEDCPHALDELFLAGTEPTETCEMHQAYWVDARDGLLTHPESPHAVKRIFIHFPSLYQAWAREMDYPSPPTQISPYSFSNRENENRSQQHASIQIVHPNDGDVYAIDPVLRREYQTIQLSVAVSPEVFQLTWYVDDEPWELVNAPFQSAWRIMPGRHRIYAVGNVNGQRIQSHEVTVYVVN